MCLILNGHLISISLVRMPFLSNTNPSGLHPKSRILIFYNKTGFAHVESSNRFIFVKWIYFVVSAAYWIAWIFERSVVFHKCSLTILLRFFAVKKDFATDAVIRILRCRCQHGLFWSIDSSSLCPIASGTSSNLVCLIFAFSTFISSTLNVYSSYLKFKMYWNIDWRLIICKFF